MEEPEGKGIRTKVECTQSLEMGNSWELSGWESVNWRMSRQACEVMNPVTWATQLGLPLRFREAIAGSWAGSGRKKVNDLIRRGQKM